MGVLSAVLRSFRFSPPPIPAARYPSASDVLVALAEVYDEPTCPSCGVAYAKSRRAIAFHVEACEGLREAFREVNS